MPPPLLWALQPSTQELARLEPKSTLSASLPKAMLSMKRVQHWQLLEVKGNYTSAANNIQSYSWSFSCISPLARSLRCIVLRSPSSLHNSE